MGCEGCQFAKGLEHAETMVAAGEQDLEQNYRMPTVQQKAEKARVSQHRATLEVLADARTTCPGGPCSVRARVVELALKESNNTVLQTVYEGGNT